MITHNWAPSSEFVSSSIPLWKILTAHAQPFRGAWDLAFCLTVPLDSLLVWSSSEGSGETARMRRLAWTFAARIGDKYQIRLTRSNYVIILTFFSATLSRYKWLSKKVQNNPWAYRVQVPYVHKCLRFTCLISCSDFPATSFSVKYFRLKIFGWVKVRNLDLQTRINISNRQNQITTFISWDHFHITMSLEPFFMPSWEFLSITCVFSNFAYFNLPNIWLLLILSSIV